MSNLDILIDGAPNKVEIGGVEFDVNSDFRVFLLFEELIKSTEISEERKPYLAIQYFYPVIPPNLHEAINKMIWFYHCGKKDQGEEETSAKTYEVSYSLKQDATLIYTAFQKEYGIDLTTDRLHWWKFIALLEPLVSGITFSEIVKCRAIKITRDMSKEEVKYYRRMKKIYAIDYQGDIASKSKKPANYDDFKTQLLEKVERRRSEAIKQAKEADKRE